jgi:small subunit ribosomal protein S6
MTVFIPDLADEDSQAEIEKIEGLVTAGGGTMTETLTASPWGRRRLAYTIRFNGVDYRDGIYTVFHFDMRPSALAELEREMKLDTNLMRYLLVHDDPKAGEKFPEGGEDEAETAESGDESAAASAGAATGGATAAAAAQATGQASTEAETTEAESAGTDGDSVPAAAEAAPVEEAPAEDTTTETAPPAADEAASDASDKE